MQCLTGHVYINVIARAANTFSYKVSYDMLAPTRAVRPCGGSGDTDSGSGRSPSWVAFELCPSMQAGALLQNAGSRQTWVGSGSLPLAGSGRGRAPGR